VQASASGAEYLIPLPREIDGGVRGRNQPGFAVSVVWRLFSPAETAYSHKGDDPLPARFDFAKTSLVLSSSGRKDAQNGVNDATFHQLRFGRN